MPNTDSRDPRENQSDPLACLILLVDYATGPFIQIPILFVIPVMLTAALHGRQTGILVAGFAGWLVLRRGRVY